MLTVSLPEPATTGELLRKWRARRHLSQLDLAHLAGTSSRHLSYVETGKARPSRGMLLRLTEALQMPLSERNRALLAAEHAPAFPDARPDLAAIGGLLETVDLMLTAHEPWPALVLDAHFDVVTSNAAVDRLLLALVDPDLLDPPVNVVRVTLHPRGLSRHIRNLSAWREHLLRQVRQHAAAAPSADLDSLLAEVLDYTGSADAVTERYPATPSFALTLELQVGEDMLRLYSTVATFGTPLDVAASELAIETFLPADPLTRAWLHRAADKGQGHR